MQDELKKSSNLFSFVLVRSHQNRAVEVDSPSNCLKLQNREIDAMPSIHRSAIIPYSTAQMYNLVNDIAHYQAFIPYCVSSVVHEESDDEIRATLTLSAKGFEKSFTTLNRLHPNRMMEIQLIDGPFKQLEGFWRFEERDAHHSEVILDLEFELSNKLFAMMFGPMFQQIASTLVDAFVKRAQEVYS